MQLDKLLEQVDLAKLDIVKSHIDGQQDMLEELLGAVSAPTDDTLSNCGRHPVM